VQDPALALAESHQVPLCPALQPVQVSPNGSTACRCIHHTSPFCVISKLGTGLSRSCRTPLRAVLLPQTMFVPADPARPPGQRAASAGWGFQPSQRGDATSVPSHAASGLCGRAGLVVGPRKPTRGGCARPHASTAHDPGRANKSAPCAERAWGCVPANLLLQAAHPRPPTSTGPAPGRGVRAGGANWQSSALHLCQATVTQDRSSQGW